MIFASSIFCNYKQPKGSITVIDREYFLILAYNSSRKQRSPYVQPRLSPLLQKRTQSLGGQVIKRHIITYNRNPYITTPIFYVNDGPHIGHLYTALLADAISRYNRMHRHTPFLSTGTDEHGNKIVKAANKANLPLDDYCDFVSQQFLNMNKTFEIQYSTFIRTTSEEHRDVVSQFWNTLASNGYIYLGEYSGWYCPSDEAFLSEEDVTEVQDSDGKSIKVSKDSGNPVEWTKEENYKFRLSAFQDDLKQWLSNEGAVRPAVYHKILSRWVEEGVCLQDLSISRPKDRVPWAIPVPTDESQSIYVWFDALVNYLTAIRRYKEMDMEMWPPLVQVIGKDILKFHGIYWPAFLMAAGLKPPETLLCHSHWLVEGQKMSKSKGNVVSPFDAANQFTAEGLRYFLLRGAVLDSDANYDPVRVQNVLNAELADTFGNLITRCTKQSFLPNGHIPELPDYFDHLYSPAAMENIKALESLQTTAEQHYANVNLHALVDAVMATLRTANRTLDHYKPWHLLRDSSKSNNEKIIYATVALGLETARVAATVLYPIIPGTSEKVLTYMKVPKNRRQWRDTRPMHLTSAVLKYRHVEKGPMMVYKRVLDR